MQGPRFESIIVGNGVVGHRRMRDFPARGPGIEIRAWDKSSFRRRAWSRWCAWRVSAVAKLNQSARVVREDAFQGMKTFPREMPKTLRNRRLSARGGRSRCRVRQKFVKQWRTMSSPVVDEDASTSSGHHFVKKTSEASIEAPYAAGERVMFEFLG